MTFPPSETVHDSASWGTRFWSLSQPTRPSNITLCTIIEGTSPVAAGSRRAASDCVASTTAPPPDWAPATSTDTAAVSSTAAVQIHPRLRNRRFMIPSLVPRGTLLDPSQEAEIIVMLHLPHESCDDLDGAREIVEVDYLVGRVGVPSRHPDTDGRDAVPAEMDRGGLRRAARQMRGELHGHPRGVSGLEKIPLHRRVGDAPAKVAGRAGENDDRPAPHDDGDVTGGARVRRVACRRAVDGDGVIGPQPMRDHGGAAQPDLLEYRADGMDGGEGLGVLELCEHLNEDGDPRAVVHAFATDAMAVGELGELTDEGHLIAHLDSQCRHLARAGRADVDVHVSDRGRPRQLFCRLQVTRFRANDAEVAVDGNATTGQEGIRGAAKAIETQKAVRLDAFHDEPDLIEVSADHQLRPVLAAATRGPPRRSSSTPTGFRAGRSSFVDGLAGPTAKKPRSRKAGLQTRKPAVQADSRAHQSGTKSVSGSQHSGSARKDWWAVEDSNLRPAD